MNHALVLEQDCSVNISGITVYMKYLLKINFYFSLWQFPELDFRNWAGIRRP